MLPNHSKHFIYYLKIGGENYSMKIQIIDIINLNFNNIDIIVL